MVKPQTVRIYLLVELDCSKGVKDLTDKAAGRVYSMDGVEGATAILLTSKEAYLMAAAQMERGQ
jgi:hypothetical protein